MDAASLEQKVGHRFSDVGLLVRAMTHSSATTEPLADNERMEFLGDSILALIISERIFRELTHCDEGDMTRFKSAVVSTGALARRGEALGLEEYAILGKGINPSRLPPSIYANLFEAIVAAVYLDAGLEAAQRMVLAQLEAEIVAAVEERSDRNYKSILQQHVQRQVGEPPRYRVIAESGPDHGKTFRVCAVVGDVSYPPAEGLSKKEAEQKAAARALESLGIEG